MEEKMMQEKSEDVLWVLVQLRDSVYAINSEQVESILVLDEDIIKLPNSDDIYVGTIFFRGEAIPVLNLRRIIGMESRETEQNGFEQMLEDRKQDHIRWVDTLKSSAVSGEPFQLAIDPHQCAFAKWYDHYEPDSQTVAVHLKKIDEPHRKLHGMAVELLSCKKEPDTWEQGDGLDPSLTKTVEHYMSQVVHLLEESKKVFRDSYRNMLVVLSNETCCCGVLVDDVLSAEQLNTMTQIHTQQDVEGDALITYIGERRESTESVLVMNLKRLFEKYL